MKTLRTAEDLSVFRNQIAAPKNQILGGLPLSRIGINVSAHQPCGLAADQFLTIAILANGLITGGAVHNHSGSRQGMTHTGRCRNPQILTDLRSYRKLGQLRTCEYHVRSEEYIVLPLVSPSKPYIFRLLISRLKMAQLIKLPVIGHISLRHHSQNLSPA